MRVALQLHRGFRVISLKADIPEKVNRSYIRTFSERELTLIFIRLAHRHHLIFAA
jgi:hypothetical protein